MYEQSGADEQGCIRYGWKQREVGATNGLFGGSGLVTNGLSI